MYMPNFDRLYHFHCSGLSTTLSALEGTSLCFSRYTLLWVLNNTGYLRSKSTKIFSPGRLVLLSTMSNDATTAPPPPQEADVETVSNPSSFASERTSTQVGQNSDDLSFTVPLLFL